MKNRFLKISIIICAFTYIIGLCNFSLPAKANEEVDKTLPEITSETAIIADGDTGYVYYEKDADKEMYPASITKLMTGLVAIENSRDDEKIIVTKEATKGITNDYANIALSPDEEITMEEALYTMFMASANDSANAIAIHVAGSIDKFTQMMNDKCKEIGTLNTHFANANGIFDEDNVTSAYDMALITRECLKNERVMKYMGETRYVMPTTNFKNETVEYATLHKMMKPGYYKYDGVYAGKTGYEKESGHTLVTVAKKDGKNLICVVMKSGVGNACYRDTTALLNYAFPIVPDNENARYVKKQYVKTNQAINPIEESNKADYEPNQVSLNKEPKQITNINKKVILSISAATILCMFVLAFSLIQNRKKFCRKLQRKINISARLEQNIKY